MKRFTAFMLAAVFVVTMSMGAFAAGDIGDVSKHFQSALTANGNNKYILLDNKAKKLSSLSELEVVPGSELKIYLTDTMFVDTVGKRMNSDLDKPNYVSRNQLQKGKITFRRISAKGSKAIKGANLYYDKKGAYIGVRFADSFPSVDEYPYSITFGLNVNGKSRKDTQITVEGVIKPETVSVYADTDYVDMSGGIVVEALERVPYIELDMGDGLWIESALARDRKYYAYSTIEPTKTDMELIEKYPGIEMIYTLQTLNLRGTVHKAHIDLGETMYVYDEDGTYLGTTKKALPLGSKYYVSSTKYARLEI